MRVLITGAAGFLGSHLVDIYLSQNNTVIGLDNLSTGSISNISEALKNSRFEFVEADVTNEFFFDVDLILNFACPASPIHYQKTPIQTLLTSFQGTINCLNLALKLKVPLVHASTSEVYGDPTVSPQNESYVGNVNPIGPRACYDEGKRAAETAIFDYIRVHDIDARVMRIFNTYGPRMAVNDGRVVSNFIVAALQKESIRIYGEGNQTRSFCYVSDTVEAAIKLAALDKRPEGPINIGNPNEMSMLQLAKTVIASCKSTSKLEFLQLPIDDPKQRCPDIGKAETSLNWSPKISLEAGLEKTIAYFEDVLRD
jgi:UDP-glucuronate decarboxylase